MVDMKKEENHEEQERKRLKHLYITIFTDCAPPVSEAIKEFRNRWAPYSIASRQYPIVKLIKEVIDPATTTYVATLPKRYSHFVAGVSAGMTLSETIRLVGLDTTVLLQRQLLRHFIDTEEKHSPRDWRFVATIDTLIGLVLDCACKRPAKSKLRGLNGRRPKGFCRFCGKPTALTSFSEDDSQSRGSDDKLRLSAKYCEDHQPELLGGISNPAYRQAKRSVAQFDIELTRLIRQCAKRGMQHAESGDPLVGHYFYHYMLGQVTQPTDKAELRNQARLMVDSKLSDRKKQMLILRRIGLNQSEIAQRLGIQRQAVSKALKSLASIPKMLQLKE